MITEDIKKHIDILTADVSEHVNAVMAYITDKSVPLSDRWYVANRVEKHLPNESFFCNLNKADGTDVSIYDSFHMNRHECRYLSELDDYLIEGNADNFTDKDIESIKEQLLDTGCGSFTHDW